MPDGTEVRSGGASRATPDSAADAGDPDRVGVAASIGRDGSAGSSGDRDSAIADADGPRLPADDDGGDPDRSGLAALPPLLTGTPEPGQGPPATPSDDAGETIGGLAGLLRPYRDAAPETPAWQYWLLVAALGIAAPFVLRAALRRDEGRGDRSDAYGQQPASPPVATGGRRPAGRTAAPLITDPPTGQPRTLARNRD